MIIKTAVQIDLEFLSENEKCVSLGKLDADVIISITKRYPELSSRLSPDTDILFWADRIKHIEIGYSRIEQAAITPKGS